MRQVLEKNLVQPPGADLGFSQGGGQKIQNFVDSPRALPKNYQDPLYLLKHFSLWYLLKKLAQERSYNSNFSSYPFLLIGDSNYF